MGYTIKLLDSEGKAYTYEGVEKIGLQTIDGGNPVYFHARYNVHIYVDDNDQSGYKVEGFVCHGTPFMFVSETKDGYVNDIDVVITCNSKTAEKGVDWDLYQYHSGNMPVWVVTVEGAFITGDIDIKIKMQDAGG